MDDYEAKLKSLKAIDYPMALNLVKSSKIKGICKVFDFESLFPLEISSLSSLFDEVEPIRLKKREIEVKEVYSCYGQYNEVANVLNELESNKIPLGEAEVIYNGEVYENLIRGLCEARGIPYLLKGKRARSSNLASFLFNR